MGYQFWEYCTKYDPRFYSEIKAGVKSGDPLTDSAPHTHDLPKGSYDVISGYFEPKSKCLYEYGSHTKIRELEDGEEVEWIKANCRQFLR